MLNAVLSVNSNIYVRTVKLTHCTVSKNELLDYQFKTFVRYIHTPYQLPYLATKVVTRTFSRTELTDDL